MALRSRTNGWTLLAVASLLSGVDSAVKGGVCSNLTVVVLGSTDSRSGNTRNNSGICYYNATRGYPGQSAYHYRLTLLYPLLSSTVPTPPIHTTDVVVVAI